MGVLLQLDHNKNTKQPKRPQTTPSISKIIGERGSEYCAPSTEAPLTITQLVWQIIWLDLTSYRGEIKKGLPDGEGEINFTSGVTAVFQKGKIQGLAMVDLPREFTDGII